VETLGPINESARAFLDDLGRQFSVLSGDDREHCFYFNAFLLPFSILTPYCCTMVFPLRTTRASFSTSNYFVFFLIFSTLVFTRVIVHTHYCHLIILSPQADNHFTIPRKAESAWALHCVQPVSKAVYHSQALYHYSIATSIITRVRTLVPSYYLIGR